MAKETDNMRCAGKGNSPIGKACGLWPGRYTNGGRVTMANIQHTGTGQASLFENSQLHEVSRDTYTTMSSVAESRQEQKLSASLGRGQALYSA